MAVLGNTVLVSDEDAKEDMRFQHDQKAELFKNNMIIGELYRVRNVVGWHQFMPRQTVVRVFKTIKEAEGFFKEIRDDSKQR